MKKILKIFCFLIISTIIIIINYKKIYAQNNNGIVQYIYNQKEFTSNEEVVLVINLSDIIKVSEIDLRIKIDNSILQPVMSNNRYFTFSALSIFDNEDIINSYTDNTLWLKLIKTHNINEDYIIGTKNNIATIKLMSLTKIKNIEEYLNDETIKIDIFDSSRNRINIYTNYSEKILYNWSLNSNTIMVNSEPLQLNNFINITNRLTNEYKLTIIDNINYNKLGLYEIKISLYDLINNDIINEVVRINVVDSEVPICTFYPNDETIEIIDKDLNTLNLNSFFKFTDNYDQYVNIVYEYYTKENEKITSLEQFINYLSLNLEAKFLVYALDTSSNASEKLEYKIKIKDTTAPKITVPSEIKITVENTINLNEYVIVSDNYDPNPNYSATYFYEDETECFDVDNAIKNGKNLIIKIIGFDSENNYTNENIIKLIVIDNIDPEIIITSNQLEDRFLKNFDYLNHFEFKDNVSKNLKIIFIFGSDSQVNNDINNDSINNKFKELLKNNLNITFSIQVKDESGNAALIEKCSFNIIDTTSPDIIIKNIENGKTYTKLSSIDYEIIDNYSKEIKTEITINNLPYNGYLDLKEGENNLSITATDEFNNTKTVNFKFYIKSEIENKNTNTINMIKKDFSSETIILVSLMILSLIIVIYRIFLINYKIKHKIQK